MSSLLHKDLTEDWIPKPQPHNARCTSVLEPLHRIVRWGPIDFVVLFTMMIAMETLRMPEIDPM